MIAQLEGVLEESAFTECVVSCGGVGYELLIPLCTFDKLPLPGNPVKLYVHTQVREDAITLFGFATAAEKSLFRLLIGVSGIGGKLALNVLSAMPVESFCAAIRNSDIKMLSRISGIGKKTAERMALELKDKVSALDGGVFGSASGSTADGGAAGNAAIAAGSAANDAALALETLGFKRDAIDKALRRILEENTGVELTSEDMLRKAIILLNF